MGMNPNCNHKRRYSDELDARAGASIALDSKDFLYILFIYKCHECAGWHLTQSIGERKYRIVKESAPFWLK